MSSVLHSPLHGWLMFWKWEGFGCMSSGGCSSRGPCAGGRLTVPGFCCCYGLCIPVTSVSCPVVGLLWSVLRLFVWLTRMLSEFSSFTVFPVIMTNGIIVSNNGISFSQSFRSADVFFIFSYYIRFNFST